MYNNEQKMGFISQEITENNEKNIIRQFSTLAKAEESLGKDLCDFSMEDIINYYKGRSFTSYLTVYNLNRILVWYTDWCIANGCSRDGINHFLEVSDKEILASCLNESRRKASVITREELLSDLETLPNPCDRFLPLALFEGIGAIDIMELKDLTMDDIEGNVVHLPTRDLEISPELLRYAKESARTYAIYPYDHKADPPCFSDSPSQIMYYNEYDFRIIKEKLNTKEGAYFQRIKQALIRIGTVLDKVVYTTLRLKSSGEIEFMRQFYPECGSLREVMAEHRGEIEHRYGKVTRAFMERHKEYLEP